MCPYKSGTIGARGREGRANYARRVLAIQASRAPFEFIPMNEKFRTAFELEVIGGSIAEIDHEGGHELRDPRMIMSAHLMFTGEHQVDVEW